MKTTAIAILIAGAAVLSSAASTTCASPAQQTPSVTWDNSGNSLLSGAYYFRYVQYFAGDQSGDLSRAISLYQTITFTSTSGTYSISGFEMDSAAAQPASTQPAPCAFTGNGTYSLAAGSGYGYISNPLNPTDVIWGAVAANGVFAGSSTENASGYNDLFIAVPMTSGSTTVSSSTLSGMYSISYLNFPNGYVKDVIAAGFQIAPTGPGSLGTVNIQAYQGNNATAVNVPEQASYFYSNGAFVLTFPGFGLAIAGQEYLYSSPDGSFVFGGSPNGYDFFVGVQANTGSAGFSGLYYQAGIEETMSASGTPVTGSMQTWHGAFNSVEGNIFSHQRILAPLRLQPNQIGYYAAPYSVTQASRIALAFGAGGGYTDPTTGNEYVVGANGAVRVGFGTAPNLGISVGLAAPAAATASSTGTGIFPAGIVNAASAAPFTAGISAGELISIYGSGFSAGQMTTVTFFNAAASATGIQAPGTAASSGQINVVVPSTLTGSWAKIQVSSGSGTNIVWEQVYQTTLGIFSQAETGLGDADATSGGVLVTPFAPAMAGSTVSVAVTGLGAIPEGFQSFAPANGLAVTIGNTLASAVFPTNLSPSGVTIVMVTIPAGLTPGDNGLTILGPDSQSMETTIFIAPN